LQQKNVKIEIILFCEPIMPSKEGDFDISDFTLKRTYTYILNPDTEAN
jgi:hypothetical protein